jgi:hypothetical protein
MRKFWWELIFALASLAMALIALRTEGITPTGGTWWVIVAGFSSWSSLLEYFLEDFKEWRRRP